MTASRAVAPSSDRSEPHAAEAAAERRSRRISLLLLTPMLAFLAICFAYPLLDMLSRSIQGSEGLTLEFYQRIIDRPVYLRIIWETAILCAQVTIVTLLLAYP